MHTPFVQKEKAIMQWAFKFGTASGGSRNLAFKTPCVES